MLKISRISSEYICWVKIKKSLLIIVKLNPILIIHSFNLSVVIKIELAVILTTISFTFVAIMFMIWILWRRKRFQRRKSQVSVIVTINEENVRRPSSTSSSIFNSSNRSISPLINCSFEKESLDFSEAHLDSSSTVTTIDDHADDIRRTYTLKEVDKICMEALKGSKRVPSATTQSTKTKDRTLCTNMNNNTIRCAGRWDACSSGYGSATSSITSSLHQRWFIFLIEQQGNLWGRI